MNDNCYKSIRLARYLLGSAMGVFRMERTRGPPDNLPDSFEGPKTRDKPPVLGQVWNAKTTRKPLGNHSETTRKPLGTRSKPPLGRKYSRGRGGCSVNLGKVSGQPSGQPPGQLAGQLFVQQFVPHFVRHFVSHIEGVVHAEGHSSMNMYST